MKLEENIFSLRNSVLPFFFFLLNFFPDVAISDVSELVKIFRKINQISHWQIEFEETVFTQNGVLQRKKGEIIFQAPLTFRISYGKDYIVSDGDLLHFVFPDKRRVYTKKLTDSISENLVVQILAGSENVFTFFDVYEKEKGLYELVAKGDSIRGVRKIIIRTSGVGFPIDSVDVLSKDLGVRIKVKKVSYRKIKPDVSIPATFELIKDIK